MENHARETSTWWGNFNLHTGESRIWRLGPLEFIVHCLGSEWQVAQQRLDDIEDDDVTWETKRTEQLPESLDNNARYLFREPTGVLTVTPRLADRPIISRPLTPFNLIGGEETTVYVSTPLWVELAAGSTQKILTEFPIQRPSDTWFGPSTREGELCYATTTHCRLNREEMPDRPHRAITPLVLQNLADTPLLIERLQVTTPLLPLYGSCDEQLWTPRVTLTRNRDGEMAELKIGNTPPQEIKGAVQLSKARKSTSSSTLIRAFNAVFG